MSNRTAPPAEVRAWAVENGYPQYAGARGRMAAEAFDAFYAAHTPSGKPKKARTS